MTLDTLRIVRNVLLRTFVVGCVFALLLALVTFGAWDCWVSSAMRMAHTDEATLVPVVLSFFAQLRFFLVFIVLAPALALHWTIKREQSRLKATPD
jgi:sterol desaturase/sphingolipid hydroxylase (fatty acid hydroxylase superfamily)